MSGVLYLVAIYCIIKGLYFGAFAEYDDGDEATLSAIFTVTGWLVLVILNVGEKLVEKLDKMKGV